MNAEREIIFKAQGYAAALLGEEDIPDLQDLLEKANDFELLVSGTPPSPEAARELLLDCPPGKSLDDKLVLGIFEYNEVLAGVMDVVRDYPERGVWWIGLLLLDPGFRGRGFGQAIYQAFQSWAAESGAVEIGLGVVEKNVRAASFWQRLGFRMIDKKPQHFGQLDQVVLVMRKKASLGKG